MDKDQADEFAGHGGSYLVDKDGKRLLVERTKQPTQDAVPEPAAPAPDKSASKPKK